MRKRAILILTITLISGMALLGAIAWASANQTALDAGTAQNSGLDAQKQVVLDAISQKDKKKADAALNEMLRQFSNDKNIAKSIYNIACKYNSEGKHIKAYKLFDLASEYSPDDMYVELSQLFCDAKNNDRVLLGLHITDLLEKQASNTNLAKQIHDVAVNLGYADRHEFAIDCYQQVIVSWPDSNQVPSALQLMTIEYSKLGDEKNADLAIERLKNDYVDDPDKAENFYCLGQYYYKNKNMYDKAAELYEFAANNCPQDDDYTMLSQVELVKYYIRTGDPVKSSEQYNKFITEFADNHLLVSNICFIGDTYLRTGDIDKARSLYNNVLTGWPSDPQTIYAQAGHAKVYAHLGLDNDANEVIDEILTNYADNPDIASAIFSIGEEYWLMAHDEFLKANPEFQGRMSVPNEEMKNKEILAKNVWEKIINQLPDSDTKTQSYKLSAMCLQDLDERQHAITYYQIIIDNWPGYEDADYCQFMIGRLYRSVCISGIITASERDVKIQETYSLLIENYPDSIYAKSAQEWLTSYEKKNENAKKPPKTIEEMNTSFKALRESKGLGGQK